MDQTYNPNAIQFGACLPRIFQRISDADPNNESVFMSKWDITNPFHRYPLNLADVGAFAYIVPSIPTYSSPLLYVYLVLPM